MNHDDLINLLCSHSFCAESKTASLYFAFLKDFVHKLLECPQNYQLYISTNDAYYVSYHNISNNHARIFYISEGLIPTGLPSSGNIIYLYHQSTKPSKQEQIDLVNFMREHQNVRYIFVGKLNNLSQSTVLRLFDYGMYFKSYSSKGYSRIRSRHMGSWAIGKKIGIQYNKHMGKKKNSTTPFMCYDYYLCHEFLLDKEHIIKFNGIMFQPTRKKRVVKKPKKNIVPSPGSQKTIEVITKYIYTNSHPRGNCLYMPDGSKIDFNKVVDKYTDIIEI